MKLQFYLRFHTQFGQRLWVSGNIDELGNNDPARALSMDYLDDEFWFGAIEIKRKELHKNITYKYILKNNDGEQLYDWGHDRQLDVFRDGLQELQVIDTWNHAGEYENVFYSDAFNKVLLKEKQSKQKVITDESFTHIFKVKAPLLNKNEVVCLLGSADRLNNWSEEKPVLLGKDHPLPPGQASWWTVKLDLSDCIFPLAYKYGVYNT